MLVGLYCSVAICHDSTRIIVHLAGRYARKPNLSCQQRRSNIRFPDNIKLVELSNDVLHLHSRCFISQTENEVWNGFWKTKIGFLMALR